jgi:hypothetical protein
VIFTYHSHKADAEAAVAAAKDAGVEAIALQLDAGDIASFDAFVDGVKEALAKWSRALRLSGQQRWKQSPQHAV